MMTVPSIRTPLSFSLSVRGHAYKTLLRDCQGIFLEAGPYATLPQNYASHPLPSSAQDHKKSAAIFFADRCRSHTDRGMCPIASQWVAD